MTSNIREGFVEGFTVVVGAVEVCFYIVSRVSGFRRKASTSSVQSYDPGFLEVPKKRIHVEGFWDDGVERIRNMRGGDHCQHHKAPETGVDRGLLLGPSWWVCGYGFVIVLGFVSEMVDFIMIA